MPKLKKAKTEPIVSQARSHQAMMMNDNLLASLSPVQLSSYHDEFMRGYIANTARLWHRMELTDDKIKPVSSKRKKSVPRHGYEFIFAEGHEDDPRAQAHMDALKFFYGNLRATDALDLNVRGGVPVLLRQMLDSVGKGYAVHEIVFIPRDGMLTAEMRFVPLWFFENTTGRLRYIETNYAMTGVELQPGEWMVTCGECLMMATAICYLYKRMPLRDWLVYCSRVGGAHGKTNASEGSSEWSTLSTALANLGLDLSILTSKDAEILPVDISVKGTLPYPPLVDLMNRAIVTIWRGGDLSTMSSGPDGVGASVQDKEVELLEHDDAELLTETLNEQLDRYVIGHMFGEEPLAWIRVRTGQSQDVKLDIETDLFLKQMGFPQSVEAIAQRYRRAIPAEGETPLVDPAATAAPVARLLNEQPSLKNEQLESARKDLVSSAVEATLAERSKMFEEWLERFTATLPERATREEYLALFEAAAKTMPKDLLTKENVQRLAAIAEGTLGAAVANQMSASEQGASI